MSADKNADDKIAAGRGLDKDSIARKAAADSLRRQIENLKGGIKPRSLNEFIEDKMDEDRKKETEVADKKES